MGTRRTALVTGGSRGIGLGICRELAAAGFDLAVNGRRSESLVGEVMAELNAHDITAVYCPGDVSNSRERAAVLEKTREKFGRLDVLVNNAGVAPEKRADVLEAGEESFDRVMGNNLKGPYFLTQSAAQWMIAQRKADAAFHGCIVNISSMSATVASVDRGDYCISKAGMAMATRVWAARLAEFGIDVFEVRPGLILTDMTAGVKDKYNQLIAGGLTVQKRWGEARDVGKAVAVLARGELPYATGQVLVVDGGLTLQRI
jgi:NAD(P)-dependent dehydrogenase (short-subunit alcohol dehydrogenase family)